MQDERVQKKMLNYNPEVRRSTGKSKATEYEL